MPVAALAAAGIGSSIAGTMAQKAAADKATNTARAGQQSFYNLDVPQIAPQQLALENFKSAGQLNPNLEATLSQGNSGLNNLQTDPRLKQAQLDALSTLQNIGNTNGMDAQSRAALLQAQQQTDAQARGAREAVLQNAAARGISGSGLELAGELGADQASANTNALAGTKAAADAQQRKLAAIEGLGSLGGQMQGTEFNQKAQEAAAQDAINRFNTSNAQQVAGINTQAQNQAQAGNLANAQNLANQNVGLSNYQQQYNKGLQQQQYQNQLQKAQGVSGQGNVVANYQNQAGQSMGKALGGLGQSALGAAGSIYANQKAPSRYDQSYQDAQNEFNQS